jgi:hypothetical protein
MNDKKTQLTAGSETRRGDDMPRKAQNCVRCGSDKVAKEGLCARCLEIRMTPAMMLDQCPRCKEVLFPGECCSCWCCRCGEVNLYGKPCALCSRVQTVH